MMTMLNWPPVAITADQKSALRVDFGRLSALGIKRTEPMRMSAVSSETTPEDAKRLLSCMQYGILIQYKDGHRWIFADGIEHPNGGWDNYGLSDGLVPFNRSLREAGLDAVRSKCYGSIRDALDAIDEGLHRLGRPSLLEKFEQTLYGSGCHWGLDYPEEVSGEK